MRFFKFITFIAMLIFSLTDVHIIMADQLNEKNAIIEDDNNLSDEDLTRGNIVIFVLPQNNVQLNALLKESANSITDVFNRMGRFLPVENNRVGWAIEKSKEEGGKNSYRRVADLLDVDIYILLKAYRQGEIIYSEMEIVPLSQACESLKGNITIRSKVLMNVPAKLSREAAYLHKNLPLRTHVIKEYTNSLFLINAGQWHGLTLGNYKTFQSGTVEIIRMGRYRSLIKLHDNGKVNKGVFIKIYPDVLKNVKRIEKRIKLNTEYFYGLEYSLLKGEKPEKKLVEGMCVINIGANVCAPGYGSFLSTRYLGFQQESVSVPGVVVSTGAIITHLTLTEFMTGFKTHFFPFVDDNNRSKRIHNLQWFLWGALPVLFSVSFLDQLAFQYDKTRHLPPFFNDKDETALVLSTIFPGGGLFYKGYRITGWGYYFAEISIAGYAVYNLGDGDKSSYAFAALGMLKLVELAHAYLIDPSYSFYNLETERGFKKNSFSFGINKSNDNESIFTFSMVNRF